MKYYHDLGVYHSRRDLSEFTVICGWVKNTEDNDWQRAIYLMPAGDYGAENPRLYYLIENPEMHAIALDAGKSMGQQQFAYDQASAALQMMGKADSLTARHNVITIINDSLDALLMMPPRPAAEKRAEADVIIVDHLTGRRTETVAMEDV